ncbi:MAG: hypothetical protein ACKPKO_29795, partial [Candidatus Fonsibacter sp.]
ETLQWQGDENLQWFYNSWKLITTSLAITIPESVLRDTFLAKIRNSKRLQADIQEFDRMREDDLRRTLKWMTESIDRLLSRDRMEWARKLQRKSLLSGAIDAEAAPSTFDKGKSKGKSKGKGKSQPKGKPPVKRDTSRDPNTHPQVKGPCFPSCKCGKCTKEIAHMNTIPKLRWS